MQKLIDIKLIRSEDHPWDPNVVEYDIIHIENGEPVVDRSGCQLPSPNITASTTMGQILTMCTDDANSHDWLI